MDEKKKDPQLAKEQRLLIGLVTSLNADEIKKLVENDLADGNNLLVNSTPTFYLNGNKINNPGSLDQFRGLIKSAAGKDLVLTTPPPTPEATISAAISPKP